MHQHRGVRDLIIDLDVIAAGMAASTLHGWDRGRYLAPAMRQRNEMLLAAGFAKVDYVEARVPATLERLGPGPATGPIRVLAAAHLGKARLIDNLGD